MAKANKKTPWLASCVVAAVITAMWCLLPAANEAAVVVQGTDTSDDTTLKTLPGLPDLTTPAATTQRPPMSAPPNYQQSATPTATVPQSLPLPPTYAPGTPASSSSGAAGAYSGLPAAPTGYGLYDNPTTQSSPLGQGTASGGLGLGIPQQPTPTSPMGMAAADPAMGRYQSTNIPEATAPRQPSQVSQTQQQMMRGQKPFSDYRAAPAYSPYMGLFREQNGRVNNYYEFVKPELEGQQRAQQVNRDIQGLQDTARYGAQSGQMSGQRPGNVVPGGETQRAPATFMHYQQFFQQGRQR
jgi:hypothetical protein